MLAEISYDLVMDDDLPFIEGCFRLPNGDWQVLIVSKRDVPQPMILAHTWASGVRGLFVKFPNNLVLNSTTIEQELSNELKVSNWVRVQGPDSMQLR